MVMAHGHGTQKSLRKLAWISSLLISLSDFFYKLVAERSVEPALGFPSLVVCFTSSFTVSSADSLPLPAQSSCWFGYMYRLSPETTPCPRSCAAPLNADDIQRRFTLQGSRGVLGGRRGVSYFFWWGYSYRIRILLYHDVSCGVS